MKIVSDSKNLQILHEDNHIIVVNKRVGDIVQGDKTGDEPLSDIVKSYLKVAYDKPGEVFLGVVHRLDRPTTGIVVFAKTSKALTRLNETFKNRETQKTYWAIVKNATFYIKLLLILFEQLLVTIGQLFFHHMVTLDTWNGLASDSRGKVFKILF